MSVPAPERKQSTAEFIHTAGEIDALVLGLRRKKYYEDVGDTLLVSMYGLASKMLECCVRANDIYIPTSQDPTTIELVAIPKQQARIQLFVEAKGYLAALDNKATELYIVKPVKHKYRGQKKKFAELLGLEYRLLKGMITSEEAKLKKLRDLQLHPEKAKKKMVAKKQ